MFCILNPVFGKGSDLVGGADADLIIDDTLIEIKTYKDLRLDRNWTNQLIGYYILNEIGKIDGIKEKIKINYFGIYYGRYGILYKFDVKPLFENVDFKKFIKWFVTKAKKVR